MTEDVGLEEIRALLSELGRRLASRGVEGDIRVVDGAAIAFSGNVRHAPSRVRVRREVGLSTKSRGKRDFWCGTRLLYPAIQVRVTPRTPSPSRSERDTPTNRTAASDVCQRNRYSWEVAASAMTAPASAGVYAAAHAPDVREM